MKHFVNSNGAGSPAPQHQLHSVQSPPTPRQLLLSSAVKLLHVIEPETLATAHCGHAHALILAHVFVKRQGNPRGSQIPACTVS